jgi:hypothetical protein
MLNKNLQKLTSTFFLIKIIAPMKYYQISKKNKCMIKLEVHNNHLLKELEDIIKKIYSINLEGFKVEWADKEMVTLVSKIFLTIYLEAVNKEKEELHKDQLNQV